MPINPQAGASHEAAVRAGSPLEANHARWGIPMGIVLAIAGKLGKLVNSRAGGPPYVAFVALVAFLFTVTLSVPFGSVLAVAVLLAPRRWRSLTVCSSVGSSLGAVVVYLAVHHLGWQQFLIAYPDIAASKGWQAATRWVSQYGAYALFVFAALPIPQSPALIFASMVRLPVLEIWLAILAGKLLKYGIYAALVARYPARFARQYGALLHHARESRP
jgi:membrane protein YqaA with SNARE-associated domain